jgi:hypothetical protein
VYEDLYSAYRKLYFGFDDPKGDVHSTLIRTAESVRREAVETSPVR